MRTPWSWAKSTFMGGLVSMWRQWEWVMVTVFLNAQDFIVSKCVTTHYYIKSLCYEHHCQWRMLEVTWSLYQVLGNRVCWNPNDLNVGKLKLLTWYWLNGCPLLFFWQAGIECKFMTQNPPVTRCHLTNVDSLAVGVARPRLLIPVTQNLPLKNGYNAY